MNSISCSIFYSKTFEAKSLKEADNLSLPLRDKFENYCDALEVNSYIRRDRTFFSPVFYRFEAHFLYTAETHLRIAAALSIFADIHGLDFCNEILVVDNKSYNTKAKLCM